MLEQMLAPLLEWLGIGLVPLLLLLLLIVLLIKD